MFAHTSYEQYERLTLFFSKNRRELAQSLSLKKRDEETNSHRVAVDAIEKTELQDLTGEIERQNATTAHLAIIAMAPAIVLYLGSRVVKTGAIATDDIGYGLLFYAVAAHCMSNAQQGALQLLLLAPGSNRFMSFARAATSATKGARGANYLKRGASSLDTPSIKGRAKDSRRKLENWPLRVMTLCLVVAFVSSVSYVYGSNAKIVCDAVPAKCHCALSGEHAVLSPSAFDTSLAMRFSTKTGCEYIHSDTTLLSQCASQMQKRVRSVVPSGTRATISLTFPGWSDTDRSLEAEFLMSGPNSLVPIGKVATVTSTGAPAMVTASRVTETARNPARAKTSNSVILVKPRGETTEASQRRRALLQDSAVPAAWTCSSNWYDATDGCDCSSCGAWDPDCDDTSAYVYGCAGGDTCIADGSPGGVCSSSIVVVVAAAPVAAPAPACPGTCTKTWACPGTTTTWTCPGTSKMRPRCTPRATPVISGGVGVGKKPSRGCKAKLRI